MKPLRITPNYKNRTVLALLYRDYKAAMMFYTMSFMSAEDIALMIGEEIIG